MELHTLICERDLHSGAASLATVIEALGTGVQLHLHDDGSLAPDDWDYLLQTLPGAMKWARAKTEEQILERLSRYPACLRYRRASPMGFKLFDLALLCSTPVFSYIDSDIVFFKRIERLFPADPEVVTYLQSDEEGFCAPVPELHWKWKIPLVVGLNAGLFQVPMAVYDLEQIEWFLREVSERKGVWRAEGLAEQNVWAMLAAKRPAFHFDRQQFHCSRFKKLEINDALVAVHCIYHLKPWVERLVPKAKASLAESTPIKLAWRPARRLTGLHVVLRRLARLRKRLVSDKFPAD
jgi:lipopolysaccharide biosynthesis glycosyltransferase